MFRLGLGEQAIVEFFREQLAFCPGEAVAYLEKVHGWGDARSFNFGMYYGQVRMACLMRNIPVVDVLPQEWMRAVEIPKQDVKKKAEHRQAIRRISGEWMSAYGDFEATNWNAAAGLIACFGVYHEGEVRRGLLGGLPQDII